MTARTTAAALAATLALCACGAEVQNESYSKVSTFEDTYDVRTRTVVRSNGSTYVTSAVDVRGYWSPCKIDSPGDCEAAARRGENMVRNGGIGR